MYVRFVQALARPNVSLFCINGKCKH